MTQLLFETRASFRAWLAENALSDEGVWLVFGKPGGPKTLKAGEALEEALCFGWIDGRMQSVDEHSYIKYFKQRNKASDWSEQNRGLVEKLEAKGLMTDFGRAKISLAKQNGRWDAPGREQLSDEQLAQFAEMLKSHENACANYGKMSRSMRKAYASSYYFGTKTEEGRQKRFAVILERLALNLNPMESMKKKTEGGSGASEGE